jgi:predicted NUDIX family NTP pyrophosphohydrolase
MPKQSAGLLVYRRRADNLEYFLVHPGGPFWKNKDDGAWSVPKGEFGASDDALTVAKREFQEETSVTIDGDFTPLKPIKQRSGKTVFCWMVKGEVDHQRVKSNTFSMEWPPRSGKFLDVPEVDRADWFTLEIAKVKILEAQLQLLDEAHAILSGLPR